MSLTSFWIAAALRAAKQKRTRRRKPAGSPRLIRRDVVATVSRTTAFRWTVFAFAVRVCVRPRRHGKVGRRVFSAVDFRRRVGALPCNAFWPCLVQQQVNS
jgi:hypothetical protein